MKCCGRSDVEAGCLKGQVPGFIRGGLLILKFIPTANFGRISFNLLYSTFTALTLWLGAISACRFGVRVPNGPLKK